MDFYSILQLPRDCSKDEIKQAFRNKAVQHHPDRHANASKIDQEFHAKCFRDASEAHEILGSDLKREVYNRSGRSAAAKATSANSSAHSGYGYSAYDRSSHAAGGFGSRSTYTGHRYAGGSPNSRSAYYRQPRRGIWDVFRMIATRSSRGDALFHALLASCLVGGTIVAAFAGDRLWKSRNRGRLFEDVERDVQQRLNLKRTQQFERPTNFSNEEPRAAATVQHHPQQQQRLIATDSQVSQPRPMQSRDVVTDDGSPLRMTQPDGPQPIDESGSDPMPSVRQASCRQSLPSETVVDQTPPVGPEEQEPRISVLDTSALGIRDVAGLLQTHDLTDPEPD